MARSPIRKDGEFCYLKTRLLPLTCTSGKDTGEGTGVIDDTRAGFKFYEDGDVIDYVVETNLLPHRGWTIPAGDPNYEVTNTREVEEDIFCFQGAPYALSQGYALRTRVS